MVPRVSRGSQVVLRIVLVALIVLGLVVMYRFVWRGGREPLVVYCAHDSVYSEKVLADFEKRTGIPVSPLAPLAVWCAGEMRFSSCRTITSWPM